MMKNTPQIFKIFFLIIATLVVALLLQEHITQKKLMKNNINEAKDAANGAKDAAEQAEQYARLSALVK